MRFSRVGQVFSIGLMLAMMVSCGAGDTYNRAHNRGANINSMIAIKNVAIALETYRVERGEYPTVDSMDQLRPVLGAYLGDERGIDRWGESLIVTVTPASYVLTSKGDDKQGGHENGGPVETAGHSITLKDGAFVQYHSSVESTARKYEAEIAGVRPQTEADA